MYTKCDMSTLSYVSNNNWFLNVHWVTSFYLDIFIAFNEHARKSYEMIKQNVYNMYVSECVCAFVWFNINHLIFIPFQPLRWLSQISHMNGKGASKLMKILMVNTNNYLWILGKFHIFFHSYEFSINKWEASIAIAHRSVDGPREY